METTIEFIKFTLATIGSTILLIFVFSIAIVEAKSISDNDSKGIIEILEKIVSGYKSSAIIQDLFSNYSETL